MPPGLQLPGVNSSLASNIPLNVPGIPGLSPTTSNPSVASGTFSDIQNIQKIASLGQTFTTDLMTKGILLQNFSQNGVLNNWNTNYPYRLTVIQMGDDGTITPIATYRLPQNPNQITINSPFAIKLTVTSRGIMEEHNGMPLKQITINGTTGIFIQRAQYSIDKPPTSILGTIFAGTVSAVNSAVSSLSSTISAFSSLTSPTPGANPQNSTLTQNQLVQSGYYQYQMLTLFLEAYASAKKNTNGRKLRLVFEMTKDQKAYVVTPGTIQTNRTASSPLEYDYTIPMTAWATIDPNFNSNVPQTRVSDKISRDIGTTQRLFNAITDARNTLTSFSNIVSAVSADIQSNIFGPINSVILFTKSLLSIGQTIADFPASIQQSFQSSIISNFSSLQSQLSATTYATFAPIVAQIKAESSSSNSFSPPAASGTAGTGTFSTSVFNNLALTDAIQISSLPQTTAQQNAINQTVSNALNYTQNNFVTLANNLEILSTQLGPVISVLDPTSPEWDILYSIQNTRANLYAFIADGTLRTSQNDQNNSTINSTQAVTAMSFWQQTATENGIGFTVPNGKFQVPFPFGGSLEELAAAYLGDATQWITIAALNGLQYPYIDENGFYNYLISNGNNSQINIASADNLYVGQTVYIQSDNQLPSVRTILVINAVNATSYLLTLSGPSNLNIYTTAESASIKAYLPYTTNSMQQIWIPSETSSQDDDPAITPITYIQDDPQLVKFSKIDFLLDSSGDLAFTNDGFLNLAFGKTNLVQAAKLKVTTLSKSLLLHPTLGAGIATGSSTADVDLTGLINNINQSFSSDPRFNVPSSVQFVLNGSVLTANVSVSVRQANSVLPVSIPLTNIPA
jgi:hypothetical protein